MQNTAPDLAISDAVRVYLLDYKASKHSKRTIEFYNVQLPPFVTWLQQQEVATLLEIRSSHVRAYLWRRLNVKSGISAWLKAPRLMSQASTLS